jgi:hypothetical protein
MTTESFSSVLERCNTNLIRIEPNDFSDTVGYTEDVYVANPKVNVLNKATTCIVYNHFDLDAMFAAAIYKTHCPNSVVYSSIKSIPLDIENYVVIGMQRVKEPKDVLANIFGSDILEKPHDIKFYWAEKQGHDYMSAPSLFHKICSEFNISSPLIDKLSYAVNRIYEIDLKLDQLVMLYTNMVLAEACMSGPNRSFIPRKVTYEDNGVIKINKQDLDNFMGYVQYIKYKLNGAVETKMYRGGGKVYKTFMTNITDNYFWSMRLIRLAHKYVMNVALTPRGYIVDTNIGESDLKSIELQISIVKAEAF